MTVAFVWDWENEPMQIWGWQDGIAAMIRELQKLCDVKVYTQVRGVSHETIFPHPYFPVFTYPDFEQMQVAVEADKPDVVLFWADMTRPAIPYLTERFPSAILFAGGEPILNNTSKFQKIFVESNVYKERFEVSGFPVVQAFGTNTELFKPKSQPKLFDVFFPACFAAWKRHELFAESTKGLRAFACGWFQEHEPWCYEACQKAGVLTVPNVPSHLLPDFYNASKCVLITSDSTGGSQRSVLEAMACNVPCIVMSDSDKTSEYLREADCTNMICSPDPMSIRDKISQVKDCDADTRAWIMANYSEFTYSKTVYDNLCQMLA